MDKKIAGLLGAAAALVISAPSSYAELLTPIPNATEALRVDNIVRADWVWNGYGWVKVEPVPAPREEPYYHHHYHHHHHHHHHHSDEWYPDRWHD